MVNTKGENTGEITPDLVHTVRVIHFLYFEKGGAQSPFSCNLFVTVARLGYPTILKLIF